jgi:2-oxoglutarate ferredoxin oxidoreductase subunit alpha
MLIPGDPKEAFEMAAQSLDLAERLQTLVFVMLDLDLGMNSWMSQPFDYPSAPIDRGKVLTAEDVTRLGGEFARYRDVDGDGIPYRTIPGTEHPGAAYFTRGTGHTDRATYSEKPKDWKANMDRLAKKFETARKLLPRPVIEGEGGEIGIIAFGSSDMATREARAMLSKQGVKTDYLRLRALPIGDEVKHFIASHRAVYIVEQNRDAQCLSILQLDCPEHVGRLHSVLHYSGMPLDAQTVVETILDSERKERN